MANCSISGCFDKVIGNGYCSMHYQRVALTGDAGGPLPLRVMSWNGAICRVSNCEKTIVAKGCCGPHYNYQRYYNLTIEQISELCLPENYKCSNTRCPSPEATVFDLDHDHSCCPPSNYKGKRYKSCGKCVRGWLCRKCNSILGFVRDDVSALEGLVLYLKGGAV